MKRPDRNAPCPCGSGKKYKKCCLAKAEAPSTSGQSAQPPGHNPNTVAKEHYNSGKTFLEQGNPDAAITSYRKALALKPDYAEAYVNLGNVLFEQGKLDEAIENHRKALLLKPGLAQAHYNLGNALYEQGKLGEATECYRRTLALKPDFPDTHNNLGLALQKQGDVDAAVACYRRALALRPDYADAHANLGNALYVQRRLEEAVASNRRAIALKPDYVEAHNNLGLAFAAQGIPEEAIACYLRALTLKPDYAEAHVNLGNLLQAQGKPDEAVEHYGKALELKPDLADAYISLGNALDNGRPGSTRESVLCFQKAFSARTGSSYGAIDELSPGITNVFLELTNKCNFHCDFCPSDSMRRPHGYMSMELARKVYDEVAEKKLAPQINLHLMGEPTLHPDFKEILAIGSSRNVSTTLITNGSTINAKSAQGILDALYGLITVSLQTPTRETYKHRGEAGLDWDRYIGNIRLLVREYLKRVAIRQVTRSTIDLRIMITRDSKLSAKIVQTEEDVAAILREWSDFVSGIELELGLPRYRRNEMQEVARKIPVTKQNGRSYHLQQGLKITFWQGFSFANSRLSDEYHLEPPATGKLCRNPFTDIGVLCNGDVTSCCLDYDGQLVVGNVRDDTLEAVINGEPARNLRAAMLSRRPLPPFCQQCLAEAVRSDPVQPIGFIVPS